MTDQEAKLRAVQGAIDRCMVKGRTIVNAVNRGDVPAAASATQELLELLDELGDDDLRDHVFVNIVTFTLQLSDQLRTCRAQLGSKGKR